MWPKKPKDYEPDEDPDRTQRYPAIEEAIEAGGKQVEEYPKRS